MQPILIVLGTRPEGIKTIPVYRALQQKGISVLLCSTAQHRTLLDDVFTVFDVKPDFELSLMKPGQDLFYLTQSVMDGIKTILEQVNPSLVLVQGDTTTAFATALAAFYKKISVGHIEAGLRTNDLYAPFPEEMNRRFISLIATYHFAPTAAAMANVLSYGIHRDFVFCTGNTVLDALYYVQQKIAQGTLKISDKVRHILLNAQQRNYKIVLFTMHRRESFGGGIERVLLTLKQALEKFKDLIIVYPVHLNPSVDQALKSVQINHERFIMLPPLFYSDLVYFYQHAHCIITDSGGIQEEATSLGKRVIVVREKTERLEGIWSGHAVVVGFNSWKIMETLEQFLSSKMTIHSTQSLYGDGHAAEYIAQILAQKLIPVNDKTQEQHL